MNGCDYLFTASSGTAVDVNGTVHIVCPGAQGIVVTVANCDIEVTPSTNLGGITYTNLGSGSTEDVTVDINTTIPATQIHVTNTGFPCPIQSGTFLGKYFSKVTAKGFRDVTYDPTPVPAHITEGAQVGVKVDP